ncbi:hypothetical protein [Nannocystis sp.]|uniref:hypothetical protein n=1 Tax=Nannocystis sp. TaxID=1962667 RepID=UPI0025E1F114|nr:hypothetical protein [Nannocystis sp.]
MGAVDDDLEAVELELGGEGVLELGDVATGGVVDADRATDLGPRATWSSSTPGAINASRWASTSSGSLKPSAANSLMPLSAKGLCEAEMTTPASARIDRVM